MFNSISIIINHILTLGNFRITDIPHKVYAELMIGFENLKKKQVVIIPELIKRCRKTEGKLIIDDTGNRKYGLKKIARKQKDLKTSGYFWGYKIVLFLWETGNKRIPIGFALWHKESSSLTELAFLGISRLRNEFKLKPKVVLADGGYSTDKLEKLLTDYGWAFVFRWKSYRVMHKKNIKKLIPRGYGTFKGKLPNKTKVIIYRRKDRFYISNRMLWTMQKIVSLYKIRWTIEEVFKILKSVIGINRCQQHSLKAQEIFLWMCMIAFSYLEALRKDSGNSIYKSRSNVTFQNINFDNSILRGVLAMN